MSDYLRDLSTKGCKILTDTKTPRQSLPKGKPVQVKPETPQILDMHQAAVKRFIKDKPHKKHLLEFFERVIEAEEKNL